MTSHTTNKHGTMPFPMNTADIISAYSNASFDFTNGNTSPAAISAAAAAAGSFGSAGSASAGQSMYQAAGFGASPSVDVSSGARRLAQELEEFVEKGLEGALAAERGEPGAPPSEDAIAELQLQTARKLRTLLPTNRDLLHLVQERNWIPLLLGWLNLHDRPAVQVEALLALTNIAELCAQQSYYQHTSSGAGAAPSPSPGMSSNYYSFPPPSATSMDGATGQLPAGFPGGYPYSHPFGQVGAAGAAPMPFVPSSMPPSTFSEPFNPENVRNATGFSSGVSKTKSKRAEGGTKPRKPESGSKSKNSAGESKSGADGSGEDTDGGSVPFSDDGITFGAPAPAFNAFAGSNFPPASGSGNHLSSLPPVSAQFEWDKGGNASAPYPSFPSTSGAPPSFFPPSAAGPMGGTPFPSFAPAPSNSLAAPAPGPSAVSSMFMHPPTPIPPSMMGGGSSIPQPLSASSQHLLLRHADAIPTLISLLSSPNREVHEQALWILGSIAAGDSSTTSSGGGNSSSGSGGGSGSGSSGGGSGGNGDKSSVAPRDVVLAAGVMTPLLRCLESHPLNLSLQRIGAWALSNLVEGQFQQQSSSGKSGSGKSTGGNEYSSSDEIDIKILLPTLRRLLHTADAEVLSYTCWTLSHLCDGPSSHIAAVVTTIDPNGLPGGLVPRLVDLLLHPSWRVTKPALRTIGNIVCAECSDDGNNHNDGSLHPSPTDYTEVILDCDAVPRLKKLITHSNREIQKEACWTLSNIAAGTVDQIQAVIDSGSIPPLVQLVSDKKTDQEVRSEACWVVLNATSCGSDQQIEVLVDQGCVSVLGVLLGEASMVMMALEGLERVLQVEESREMARRARIAAARMSDGADLDDVDDDDDERPPTLVSASLIEKALEKHNSNAVSKRASRIWKQHFVSCALCRQSFSRHRIGDARWCEECKCHVCSSCDCQIYHLSYQEELWAVNEEKTEAKKNAKKSKKQKKKEKRKEKEKKAKKLQTQNQQSASANQAASSSQQQQQGTKEGGTARSRSSTVTSSCDSASGIVGGTTPQQASGCPPVNELSVVSSTSVGKSKAASVVSISSEITDKQISNKGSSSGKRNSSKPNAASSSRGGADGSTGGTNSKKAKKKSKKLSPSPSNTDDEVDVDEVIGMGENPASGDCENNHQPPIDFVLYLQQTGSIIALAKLMDALDYGDGDGSGYDDEIDAELQILSRQEHLVSRKATT